MNYIHNYLKVIDFFMCPTVSIVVVLMCTTEK